MNNRFVVKSVIAASACMVLCGCISTPYYSHVNQQQQQQVAAQQQITSHNDYVVETDLNQAAQKVAVSLTQLAEIEKSNYQGSTGLPFANIQDPALSQDIAISWYGPIAPILQSIADRVGYQFQVFGKAPQTPVLVNVDSSANPTSALNLLRDLDLQAGQNANIMIYPDTKIISLRYLGT